MKKSIEKKHITFLKHAVLAVIIGSVFSLVGCSPEQAVTSLITVQVEADNRSTEVQIPPGITADKAVELAGFQLNALDRLSVPSYSILSEDTLIEIIRVTETFDIEEVIIPFETQTMKNETLPEGQTLLIQSGVNGLRQNTYRILNENGQEVSRTLFKQELVVDTRPEIVMVGIQTPFIKVNFPGTIAFLTAGNAWLMKGNSGERSPVVTSGNLDGRVFSLSPDGNWLLFTRTPEDTKEHPEIINELCVINLAKEDSQPLYLSVDNVIHFAEWHPNESMTIAYSTVEYREIAPGWQANNDLYLLVFNSNGSVLRREQIVDANSGGIYGWWGSNFGWSPDGSKIAYSRPDGIGIIETESGAQIPVIDIIPLETRGNWAWVSGFSWSPDEEIIYYNRHGSNENLDVPESSQVFSLAAHSVASNFPDIQLIDTTGMFAYPVTSPYTENEDFFVAFLKAIFPDQSETSAYHLMLMQQDGSNLQKIFPPEGSPGLDPQNVKWVPQMDYDIDWIAVIYQGNLWLVDPLGENTRQLTGDKSITRIDWK